MVSYGVSILTREDPAPLRSRAIRRLVFVDDYDLFMIYSYVGVLVCDALCIFIGVIMPVFSCSIVFRCRFDSPEGRQGSTTVMLMLQTVSSPIAMSLPMPSTWTMDVGPMSGRVSMLGVLGFCLHRCHFDLSSWIQLLNDHPLQKGGPSNFVPP